MRRVTLWLISTIAVLVLLISYRTSRDSSPVSAAHGAQAPGVVGGQTPGTTPTASGSGPAASTTPKAVATTTVNGTVAPTQWGPVQVQVTLSGTRITDVAAIVYPSGNGHDASINAYALPLLRQQVLSAQSAQIDGVSGATVTSDGYRTSLQAALDAAHFGK